VQNEQTRHNPSRSLSHTHTHTHTFTHTRTHTHSHIHTFTHTHTHSHIHTRPHPQWNEPEIVMRQGSFLGIDPCVYDIHDQVTAAATVASKTPRLTSYPYPFNF
jgi:hypothetical protein